MYLKKYFYNFIFFIFVIFSSCNQNGSLIPQGINSSQNIGTGGNNSTTDVCNHKDATNYKPGTVGPNQSENCLFDLCTNPSKIGFNETQFDEIMDYISKHGGTAKNNEQKCGDFIFKLPSQEVPFPSGYNDYHTYKEYVEEINNIVGASNGLARLVSIGSSSEGLPIYAVRVSNDSKNADSHPTLLVVGTHHAREHLSTETPLLILKKFVDNAKSDVNIRNTLTQKTLYFIPLLNPDGAIYDLSGGKFQFWRKNTRIAVPSSGQRGVDLNRNYDANFAGGGSSDNPGSETYHGPNAFSEPETTLMKNFIESKTKINFVLTFHSFSELILYPWGGKNEPVPQPDLKVFQKIASVIQGQTGYSPMQASNLYIATGDLCDWSYGKHSILCITIELTPKSTAGNNGFYPSGSVIKGVVDKNYPVFEYLLSIIENPRSVAP